MSYLLVRHKVENFDTWKSAYDSHHTARAVAGLKEVHLLRNQSDPNDIVILFEAHDMEKARAFASSHDLRQVMKEAGVRGTPEILELQ
jgi:hypothetical protein